jgi:hypothetical protein
MAKTRRGVTQVEPRREHLARRVVPELGHGGVRLGLASRSGLLEQLAELDLRGPFGLTGLPQPDLSARQRISPGVDTYAERTAGELLDVTPVALAMTAR